LVFQARIASDRREIYPGVAGKDVLKVAAGLRPDDREKFLPWHVGDKVGMQVIRKPLEILLFTSGALRDYQFVRTLMVREMEKDRVGVSIFLQNPPGREDRRTGIIQDVPNKRFLDSFPTNFDQPADDEEKKLNDLATYDVIIAFDPDWTQLSDQQLQNVLKWSERGGGLIVVGGPINTLQMARPGPYKDKLKPILELYPVILKDVRIEDEDRKPDKPWPLTFDGASPDMEYLKLSDEVDRGTQPFLSDWQAFWGRTKDNPDRSAVERGFYNYYPVETVKSGSIVVARFTDPLAKDKEGKQMPFLVTTAEGNPRRVIWIAAGEMWRLREYKESFHERFWTKLVRFAGATNQGKSSRRITSYVNRRQLTGRYFTVEARIDGKGGEPLGPRAQPPEVNVTVPVGVNPKEVQTQFKLAPKPGSVGWWTARMIVRSPGNYDVEIRVPETKDTHTDRITVEQANPELDDTKPDFDTMYRMASEAKMVLGRMGGPEKKELLRRLAPPALADGKANKPEAKTDEEGEDKLRLYFDLKNADLIPDCMKRDVGEARSRGPVADLWDQGFAVWQRDGTQGPIRLSHVLVAVVGLLSLEWLIRKLLRLA
jgi:hypothetical protein